MTGTYEEILQGETFRRFMPGRRHELICERLHELVRRSLQNNTAARLLPARSIVQIAPGTMVRPDLTIVTSATGKAWLLAEIINSEDHRTDTVLKKQIFEELNLPRVWMIDPRYDNVEIYHGTPHGLTLRRILAGSERLEETLLPGLSVSMNELFAEAAESGVKRF